MKDLNPKSLLKSFKITVVVVCHIAAISAIAAPLNSIEIGWDAVSEPGIEGYKVYVGTASNQYSRTYDAGTNLSLTVPDLVWGTTYFFAVKSIDSTGLESAYSDEFVLTIATPPLPTGGGMTVDATGLLALTWSFPTAAMSSAPEFIIEQSSNLVNWTVAATIPASSPTGGTGDSADFSWPIGFSGARKFYRLTARNWLGTSTGP